MKELHRTSNPVEITWLRALMSEHGIHVEVLDESTAQAYGSALIPRRVMVRKEDLEKAQEIFEKAQEEL